MKIVLIGGRGYIGGALSNYLSLIGHQVFITTRGKKEGFIQLDVTDELTATKTLFEMDPDVVVNLSWSARGEFWHTSQNFEGLARTLILNRILFNSRIWKYICIGSSAEYKKSTEPVSPKVSILEPDTVYGLTKVAAFRNFNELNSSSEVTGVWIRPFNLYGKDEDLSRLIPSIITHIKSHQKFKLSKPEAIRDWVHIYDLASAVTLIIEQNPPAVLNIGTGIGTKNREICLLAEKHFGLDWVEAKSNSHDIDCLVASNDDWLISRWKPKFTVERFFSELKNEEA